MLIPTSTGDSNTGLAQSLGSLGSGVHKVLFEPSKRLWQVWGLILNMISPLLLSCWGFSFALGHGVSFFGGIQHSAVDGCSAASCNFGVLAGEDECISFYSTVLVWSVTCGGMGQQWPAAGAGALGVAGLGMA